MERPKSSPSRESDQGPLPSVGDALKNMSLKQGLFRRYRGDLYGTRGSQTDGILYMSRLRLDKSAKYTKAYAENEKRSQERKQKAAHEFKRRQSMVEDNSHFVTQKRQCALALEKMIEARSHVGTTGEENVSAIRQLLNTGMIESLLKLTSLSDLQTNEHCLGAFQYLVKFQEARQKLLAAGIVTTICAMMSNSTPSMKSSACIIFCYLSLEPGSEIRMLTEGVDVMMLRLCKSNAHVVSICATTYLNLSCTDIDLGRYTEPLTQAVVTVTKMVADDTAVLPLLKAIFNLSLNIKTHNKMISDGIDQILLLHLKESYQDEARSILMRAVVNLCSIRASRRGIVAESAVLQLIVNSLRGPGDELVSSAALVILRLSSDKENRSELLNAGVLRVIVASLAMISVETYTTYSWIIRNLCSDPHVREEVLQDGVANVLLTLCQSSVKEVKINSLWTLCNFISDDFDHDTLSIENTIRDLVNFDMYDSSVSALCASAMYKIACASNYCENLFQQHGIINALLALLHGDQETFKYALMLAYRFSRVPVLRSEMLQKKMLPFLIKAVGTPGKAAFAASTIENLRNEASFPRADNLSELFTTIFALARDTDEADLNTQLHTVSLVAGLSTCTENLHSMARLGVMSYLRWLHSCEDERIIEFCVYILYELSQQHELHEALFKEGMVPLLVHLSRAASDAAKELCVLAFCRLSKHSGTEKRLVEQGAIAGIIIMALVSTDINEIKAECCKVICNCLADPSNIQPMVNDGILWALTTLCQLPSQQIQFACAVALCNLSFVPESRMKMLESGVPRALIVLSKSGDTQTILACLKSISNFLEDPAFCSMLIREGIITLLREFIEKDDETMVHLAASVLLKICCVDERTRLQTLQNGLLYWISRISLMDNPELTHSCVIALHDITSSESTRDRIGVAQVSDILHRAQKICTKDVSQLVQLRVFYNMSSRVLHIDDVIAQKVTTTMRTFLDTAAKSDRLHSKQIARLIANIMYNVSCTSESHTELVAMGIVDLVATLSAEYINTRYPCILALCNVLLGRINSSRVVREGGGKLLVNFIKGDTIDMNRDVLLCSAALRKLSSPLGNQIHMIQDGVIDAIIRILQSDKACVQAKRNALETAAALSKIDKNRGPMVQDGIITALVQLSSHPNLNGELLHPCFETLSNVAMVDTDDYDVDLDENFIFTLMRLSESNPLLKSSDNSTYHERGQGKSLPEASISDDMMLSLSECPVISVRSDMMSWVRLEAAELRHEIKLIQPDETYIDPPKIAVSYDLSSLIGTQSEKEMYDDTKLEKPHGRRKAVGTGKATHVTKSIHKHPRRLTPL